MIEGKIPKPYRAGLKNETYSNRGDAILCGGETVRGAHIPSFLYFDNGFAKDQRSCYCMGSKLKGTAPENFRVLNYCYVTDGQNVWTLGGKVKDADAPSFQVCDEGYLDLSSGGQVPYGYAKDINNVYYFNFQGKPKKLPKANPDTFVSLKDCYFGKDNKSVFFGFYRLPGAKVESWQRLSGHYSKDQKNVFHGNHVIKGADLDSFTVDSRHLYLAKDKSSYYRHDKKISESDYVRVLSKT